MSHIILKTIGSSAVADIVIIVVWKKKIAVVQFIQSSVALAFVIVMKF